MEGERKSDRIGGRTAHELRVAERASPGRQIAAVTNRGDRRRVVRRGGRQEENVGGGEPGFREIPDKRLVVSIQNFPARFQIVHFHRHRVCTGGKIEGKDGVEESFGAGGSPLVVRSHLPSQKVPGDSPAGAVEDFEIDLSPGYEGSGGLRGLVSNEDEEIKRDADIDIEPAL